MVINKLNNYTKYFLINNDFQITSFYCNHYCTWAKSFNFAWYNTILTDWTYYYKLSWNKIFLKQFSFIDNDAYESEFHIFNNVEDFFNYLLSRLILINNEFWLSDTLWIFEDIFISLNIHHMTRKKYIKILTNKLCVTC